MPLKDSSRLGELRKALLARSREIERERAEAAARRTAEERVAQEFRQAMAEWGGVEPLLAQPRHVYHRLPPAPAVRPPELDHDVAEHEPLSDQIDVDALLDADGPLSFHRPGIGPDVVRKLRRGHWAVRSEIDLHGLRIDEARNELGAFLSQASQLGARCVRVVHGKGLGSRDRQPVLKGKVRAWLVQREDVIAFVQARAAEGGSGALVVLLTPDKHPPRTTNR